MEQGETKQVGWFPLRGSWEEAVLSWNEQVEISFRRRELAARKPTPEPRERVVEDPRVNLSSV